MVHPSAGSRRALLFSALVGVGFCCAIGYLLKNGQDQERKIHALEDTIRRLQSSSPKEQAPAEVGLPARHRDAAPPRLQTNRAERSGEKSASGHPSSDKAPGSLQILRDLETVSDTDPRTTLEKVQELLSGSPSEERAAIVSRFIFDKARDPQGLPDYALQSLYASQSNADLKRVIAQVLSQRGNDALLNNQIAEAQARLMSARPEDRQAGLAQLAKMHSTKAVDAIAPFLQDPDTTVRLEALFALRDSGNQLHANLVEGMLDDPDPSVSTLAADVLSSLRSLSASARTHYSRSDIEAELPPLANP